MLVKLTFDDNLWQDFIDVIKFPFVLLFFILLTIYLIFSGVTDPRRNGEADKKNH